eukprot:725277-Heterocapsa_arctica.AAC.1
MKPFGLVHETLTSIANKRRSHIQDSRPKRLQAAAEEEAEERHHEGGAAETSICFESALR